MRICNFTPGPWAFHKYPKLGGGYAFSIRVKDCPGITIANLSPGNTSDRIEPVCEANAALISAAPELLSALDGIVARLERWQKFGIQGGTKGLDADFGDLHLAASAAIVKAKGKR